MRRAIRTLMVAVVVAGALSIGTAQPATAAIHEIVAKFCGNGNLGPGGQLRFGEQSFLRALQATGVYTINFGSLPPGGATILPPGSPATAAPGTQPVTVEVDFSRPPAKFSDIGPVYFRFVEGGLTVFLRIGAPDHPAFENCKKLNP